MIVSGSAFNAERITVFRSLLSVPDPISPRCRRNPYNRNDETEIHIYGVPGASDVSVRVKAVFHLPSPNSGVSRVLSTDKEDHRRTGLDLRVGWWVSSSLRPQMRRSPRVTVTSSPPLRTYDHPLVVRDGVLGL